MAEQAQSIQINKNDKASITEVSVTDLTRLLFESQSTGLAELYEQLNKNISINEIIESSISFQRKKMKFCESPIKGLVLNKD